MKREQVHWLSGDAVQSVGVGVDAIEAGMQGLTFGQIPSGFNGATVFRPWMAST